MRKRIWKWPPLRTKWKGWDDRLVVECLLLSGRTCLDCFPRIQFQQFPTAHLSSCWGVPCLWSLWAPALHHMPTYRHIHLIEDNKMNRILHTHTSSSLNNLGKDKGVSISERLMLSSSRNIKKPKTQGALAEILHLHCLACINKWFWNFRWRHSWSREIS